MRAFVLLILLAIASPAFALQADELLLIANKNVPQGVALAKYYAKLRNVPADRILLLDIPGSEEIPYELYESTIVPAVRNHLKSNALEKKVECLVTFYGIPLKLKERVAGPEIIQEKKRLDGEILHLRLQIEPVIMDLEKTAQQLDPSFKPGLGQGSVEALAHRAELAGKAISAVVSKNPTSPDYAPAIIKLNNAFQQLIGKASVIEQMAHAQLAAPSQTPQEAEKWTALLRQVDQAKALLARLSQRRGDPEAREALRKLLRDDFGLLEYTRMIMAQADYIGGDATLCALDSELSMLWWDYFHVASWAPNPLYYQMGPADASAPHTLMVSRIDGPDAEKVTEMILATLKVEKEGLKGRFVVDSRGLDPADKDPKTSAYAAFDERVRALARFLKTKTQIALVWDDKPDVIKRTPETKIRDVAVYTGWYALCSYTPAFQFKLGAVGYHIASAELNSLRVPTGNWCRGLINDGVVATLGPVNEPYLQAFPPPDEFVPLLMTGKLTLAECYWKTIPWTSWQMALIGDPLYMPFKQNPIVRVEDLPPRMQAIFANASTRPITFPTITVPANPPTTAPAAAPSVVKPSLSPTTTAASSSSPPR